jgi:cyanophycin synthetase
VAEPVRTVELRVLEGPNLYFPRPAIKLTLEVPGWLRASPARVAAVAAAVGVPGVAAGAPGSEQRLRATARIAVGFTRRIAAATGPGRLAVRGRTGPGPGRITVAFPWRRQGAAEALGRAVAVAMGASLRRSPSRLIAELAAGVAAVDRGPEATVPDPDVPVIQVTGTNGKTTTTRLLAHIVMTCGKKVAFSSTDGVYRNDRRVLSGDYSGFGGAATALAQHPDVAVLETARGGILLRGIGVQHNDVAVVTNVSADHLDLHGISTVDQLAEVKATITRITRPNGWAVLNADDPRVLAMRRTATGRPWLFSLDPRHPALREALAAGGRAITVLDGDIVWIEDSKVHEVVPIDRVPVTLAGLSGIYIQNALAATAAALAVGLPERSVARGLRTFVLDPKTNPGRTNLFALDRRLLVLDYAHNEAGMDGLVEILRGLRPPGREIWLAIGTAGDRTDEILHGFAVRAALGADHLAIAEQLRYLRGRPREDVIARLREGAGRAGMHDVPVYIDEMRALRAMLKDSAPGDVVGITVLAQRAQAFRWLRGKGARLLGPADVRRRVRAVREARQPA